jgi:hypothetical protein
MSNQQTPIEKMCADAQKRIAEFINRSAGQHLRAMKPAAPKQEKSK